MELNKSLAEEEDVEMPEHPEDSEINHFPTGAKSLLHIKLGFDFEVYLASNEETMSKLIEYALKLKKDLKGGSEKGESANPSYTN